MCEMCESYTATPADRANQFRTRTDYATGVESSVARTATGLGRIETIPTPQAPAPLVVRSVGVSSKATTANPKDLVGSNKVSITKLPMIAVVHGAMAMMDGASKYNAYNFRAKPVQASIYVDAAIRHLMTWFEGQENASDSGVHHLGHAIGCCAILLDCQAKGNLIDDRPISPDDLDFMEKQLTDLSEVIKLKKATQNAKA